LAGNRNRKKERKGHLKSVDYNRDQPDTFKLTASIEAGVVTDNIEMLCRSDPACRSKYY
jgi:hypothetical protein